MKIMELRFNRILLLLIGVAALVSSFLLSAGIQSSSSQIIKQLGDDYYEWLKQERPSLRLRLGLKIERLPEVLLAKAERDAGTAQAFLSRLEKVRPEELSHEEVLSLDVLRRRFRDMIDDARFYWLEFPAPDSVRGANSTFEEFVFKDKAAAENYLELVDKYPKLMAQVRDKLKGQFDRGIIIPRLELELVVPFLRSNIGDIDGSPLGVNSSRLKSLSPDEAEGFRARLSKALEEKVNPEMKNLIAFIEGDYRKKAPETVGLDQYPGGKEYYAWLVKSHTTLDVTPEEVHRIGLQEVERLNARMDKIQISLGFKGTRAEFRNSLRNDARFYPQTPAEVGERLMSAIRRIEPGLDGYFLRRPKAPYGVKRLDPKLEATMTFGYYQEPTAADPTGYYLYNAGNLKERSLLNAAELIYHELIPGHHFQIMLAHENRDIPPFRRESEDGAYAEGWAEYAASLAGEMGMYSDPYDLYGRLSCGEAFLSARLVVDTGMNALVWPLEKAESFIRENAIYTDNQIHSEALRYSCGSPGQALSYRMGHIKFRELREKAQAALGQKFDIRRFHDALLGSGSLPLTTLERHIDWFIGQEKERK